MAVAVAEAPFRRARARRDHNHLVQARGLRMALKAATRAGRSPQSIASDAGVRTRGVRELLDGTASHATPKLASRIERVVFVWERVVVIDVRSGHLPYVVVSPLVEQSVAQHGIEATASACRMSVRRLCALRFGETRMIHLSIADRIVVGLRDASIWFSDPALRPWYWQHVATT